MNKLIKTSFYSFLLSVDWEKIDKGDVLLSEYIKQYMPVKKVEVYKNEVDTCLCVEEKNDIIISFRATHNMKGWHRNFSQSFTSTGILEGFWKDTMAFIEQIRNFINNDKEIFVTGHSRGGALASITAALLTMEYGVKRCNVISYGAPPYATNKWKDVYYYLPIYTTRVTTLNDIVSNLNKKIPLLRHVGEEVKLPLSNILQLVPIMSLYSHHPVFYVDGVYRLLKKKITAVELQIIEFIRYILHRRIV